jgi:membrane protease YdiL (CAAX protease family)
MSTRFENIITSPPQRIGAIQQLVTVSFVLLFAVFPLFPGNFLFAAVGVITILTIMGWFARWVVIVPLGLFCVICMTLASFGLPSQIWFALGLGAYLTICKSVQWLHGTLAWLKAGAFTYDVVLLTIASALLATIFLIVWFLSVQPNITGLINTYVPKWNIALLILGGLMFSIVNAAVEEGAYRGVIMAALDKSIGSGVAPVLLQAAAFGTLHINGFPRGWIGVGLASVFGLLMALIRKRSQGMLAPWAAHVCTDIVIVGIVMFFARTA